MISFEQVSQDNFQSAFNVLRRFLVKQIVYFIVFFGTITLRISTSINSFIWTNCVRVISVFASSFLWTNYVNFKKISWKCETENEFRLRFKFERDFRWTNDWSSSIWCDKDAIFKTSKRLIKRLVLANLMFGWEKGDT